MLLIRMRRRVSILHGNLGTRRWFFISARRWSLLSAYRGFYLICGLLVSRRELGIGSGIRVSVERSLVAMWKRMVELWRTLAEMSDSHMPARGMGGMEFILLRTIENIISLRLASGAHGICRR